MPSEWLSTHLKAARPRVIGALNRYFRSIDLAEDAFQEAAARAVRVLTPTTQPKDLTAWLIVTGRNYGIDQLRKSGREATADPVFWASYSQSGMEDGPDDPLDSPELDRDDVLRLIFTCCHPVLRREQQIALSLKIIAGLKVEEIARAFLVRPKTMEQRITRAKRRIAAANPGYEPPSPEERAGRLSSVASAVYLLFNEGYYTASPRQALLREDLCNEAIRLARLLARLYPELPEQRGLLALCLAHHARQKARFDAEGHAVTLGHQDRSAWDKPMIAEARALLETALRNRAPGPFQIEAAIAITHCLSESYEQTNWVEIETLYRALEEFRPTPVVRLNRGAALAKVAGPAAALDLILPLAEALDDYPLFHATAGALQADLGKTYAAVQSFERALGLSQTQVERAHIENRLASLRK